MVLHYEKSGTGPPLVALHGFGASIYTWHAVRSVLEARRTVYALDLKGHGLSPKPADGKYSVHDQAALVREFIEREQLTGITLVGHSFGGGVALALVVQLEAERPGVLASLILFDAASYRQRLPSFIKILRTPIVGWLSQHLVPVETQVRVILKIAYFHDTWIPETSVDAYAAPLRMPGGKQALRATAKQILPDDIDQLAAKYPSIRVPALVVWGRQDEIVPLSIGETLSGALPNATFIVLDGCGHLPHEEWPAPVRDALDKFL